MSISPEEHNARKQWIEVAGRRMAYVDLGEGERDILLLHGNPTSSFLWRDVIEPLRELGRCIAPDLIGMGDSDKLPDPGPETYTLVEHRRYLDALLDRLGRSERLFLVCHDWGSALCFDWARRHPDRVAGIAYTEAIVMPVTWDQWPKDARRAFQGLRSEAGEQMALDSNFFVERILPSAVLRQMSDEEMNEYRRPFAEPGEDRRPTLTWPRQLPIDGEPEDVTQIVEDYGVWLEGSDVPKLFINAEPGAILTGDQREYCRSWPNQREVTVPGAHFVPEDSGAEIGEAVAEWIRALDGQ